jgi:hypothetical protein
MKRSAKISVAAAALMICAEGLAQGTYKCKDAAGRITYSGAECHLIGLTSAGEVKGRASITPALKFQPQAPKAAPAATAAPSAAEPESPPKEPDRRCFVVKSAKGSSTRCDDVPGKEN